MGKVHERAPGLPIIALGETAALEKGTEAVLDALRHLHSILYLYEDTVPFLARQIMRAASDYLEDLLPPFFKALAHHAAGATLVVVGGAPGPRSRATVHALLNEAVCPVAVVPDDSRP